jgi:hypothetical protein
MYDYCPRYAFEQIRSLLTQIWKGQQLIGHFHFTGHVVQNPAGYPARPEFRAVKISYLQGTRAIDLRQESGTKWDGR